MEVYKSVSVLDTLIFLNVAETPEISPPELADKLDVPLTTLKKAIYGLERGRSDNDAKALGLVEIHVNPMPGHRHQRMLKLSAKGERLFAKMMGA